MSLLGTWDAYNNIPYIHDGTGTAGDSYLVIVDGTIDLGSGNITFAVNDEVYLDGALIWTKITGGGGGGSGTVTSITAGTGLTGGTITTSGTISLATVGTPGTYGDGTNVPQVTTDAYGRVTSVVNVPITAGGTGTVTSVAFSSGTGISLSGTNPITSSGTITITNSAPDQTIVLTNGTGISITGTYPNFTITNSAPSTVTPAALTKVDDTNVTLTLGGTPSTALLQAVSLTLGWTGTLADGRIASAATWNAKQDALSGTGVVKSTAGTISYISGTSAQFIKGDGSLDSSTYLTAVPSTSINGTSISFGSSNTITAAAGTLTGTTLNSTVVTSSLTTVGTIGTGVWQGTAIGDTYISSATNWNTAYTNRITSLTTTGSSGAATLSSNVLNIPNYTLSGLGGFANPMTTSGDIIYGGTSGTATRLAGNTTSTKKYLSQTGTGTVSAAPAWAQIAVADLSDGTTGSGSIVLATSPIFVTPTLGTPASGTLTNCTGLPVAGITSSTSTALGVGSIELGNASDTTIARVSAGVISVEGVTVPTISSTSTLTNKRVNPRTGTNTSDTSLTIDSDSYDRYTLTAMAGATTINAPTGTPVDGQKLIIRLKDNGTARALTWNAAFRASSDLALPTTTVISKTLYCGFSYNSADSKWDLLAYLNNF